MANMIHYMALFVAKVADNALGTSKTIFIQRSKWILAGISVVLSDFLYLYVMKNVVNDGGGLRSWPIRSM